MPEYPGSLERTLPPTARLYTNIPPPSKKLLIENLTKDDMLGPSPAPKSKNESAPFKPPHSPWCPRRGSQANFVSYKICPFPETTQSHNPSTTRWTPMPSHAHGERSPPSAHSSTPSPQDLKGPAEISPKHIESSRWRQTNGPEWSSDLPGRMNSESINATHLAVPQQAASLACSPMRWQTSSELRASVPHANGSTTKPSSASHATTSPNITKRELTSEKLSSRQEDGNNREAGCGQVEDPCQTDESRNLTKTCHFPSRISLQTAIMASHMTYPTSTAFPPSWVSHGNAPKILTSVRPSPSSASSGILKKRQSHCDPRKRKNISLRSKNGRSRGRTPWQKSKNYMENCHMPLWRTQMEDPTSLVWNPCLESSITVLTFHAPHLDNFPPILPGGSTSYPNHPIPTAHEVLDIAAFSDASSSTGIAIVIGKRWRAWKLLPGWNADKRDIGWAEAVGFELLTRTIARLHSTDREDHFEIYGDNQGVVEGWKRGRSRNPRVNEVFKRVTALLRATGITIHTRYVRSARNPADDPSRGIYPPTSLLLPPLIIPDELKGFIVDYDHTTNDHSISHGEPHTSTRVPPKPKPVTKGGTERERRDETLSTMARQLYEAKTRPQWI